jgi:hypothetical protein
MTQPTREQIQAISNAALAKLKALGVDSAVLICTFETPDDSGSTSHFKGGFGNYYAQRGSVIEWIDQTRCVIIENQGPQAGDDDQWWKG